MTMEGHMRIIFCATRKEVERTIYRKAVLEKKRLHREARRALFTSARSVRFFQNALVIVWALAVAALLVPALWTAVTIASAAALLFMAVCYAASSSAASTFGRTGGLFFCSAGSYCRQLSSGILKDCVDVCMLPAWQSIQTAAALQFLPVRWARFNDGEDALQIGFALPDGQESKALVGGIKVLPWSEGYFELRVWDARFGGLNVLFVPEACMQETLDGTRLDFREDPQA